MRKDVFVLDIDGKKVKVDEDGFLIDYSDYGDMWRKNVAREEGIKELSDNHWTLIKVLQDYYEKNGTAPMVRILSKLTKFKLRMIYELFPSGPGLGACKMAGLPKPVGCVSDRGPRYKKLPLGQGEFVDVDQDGFLLDPDKFSKAWLDFARLRLGISSLEDDHFALIEAAQVGFQKHGYPGFLPKLKATANIGASGIRKLFPKENELGICFLAGLPKPFEVQWSIWEKEVESVVLDNATILPLDSDGFPLYPIEANDAWLSFVMEREGIDDWTDEHKALVRRAFNYFRRNGIFPMDRVLLKLTKFKMKHVYELFPRSGPKGACRSTGMPQRNN